MLNTPATAGDNTLVAIAAFPEALEAHLLRGCLEDDGLFCVLSNEFIAATDLPLASITGGVQVLVRTVDAARAQAVIQALQDAPLKQDAPLEEDFTP